MMTWLAKNGSGEDAIDWSVQFSHRGLKPDAQIFAGVFFTCNAMVYHDNPDACLS
jgi:pentatricopeptide repeat protein